jgi:hypothetical protein
MEPSFLRVTLIDSPKSTACGNGYIKKDYIHAFLSIQRIIDQKSLDFDFPLVKTLNLFQLRSKESHMATWADVRSHIASKYRIANDNGTVITMEFDTGNGRSQLVLVAGSDTTIQLKSPFAKEGQVQPGKVIQSAGMFGVCQVNELYCLTHLMLTETLDALEFDVPLRLIVEAADEIEKNLGLGDSL